MEVREFDPDDCPLDCSRPCEKVCPANAISQAGIPGVQKGGVLAERCYGCGRCFPVCPYDKISAITYVRDVTATAELLGRDDVDAIEIYTSGRLPAVFKQLWTGLGNSVANLKLMAVSFPDLKDSIISAMQAMYTIMEANLQCFNLWQAYASRRYIVVAINSRYRRTCLQYENLWICKNQKNPLCSIWLCTCV